MCADFLCNLRDKKMHEYLFIPFMGTSQTRAFCMSDLRQVCLQYRYTMLEAEVSEKSQLTLYLHYAPQ